MRERTRKQSFVQERIYNMTIHPKQKKALEYRLGNVNEREGCIKWPQLIVLYEFVDEIVEVLNAVLMQQ